jgi:hypothetical protein
MYVCAPRMSLFFSQPAPCNRSGWREPAVVGERTRPGKDARHCKCVSFPRRADTRRSCERAFVHCKNRCFAGRRSHCNTRAGGRKPPVAPINAIATAIYAHARTPSAICRRTTLLSADTHLPAHGGLTCAALDESVRNCNCVTHTHGGLTPAALGRTCVCAPRMSLFFSRLAPCNRSGWRKPAVVGERTRRGKDARHCKCVSFPRRADTRRSWSRSFPGKSCSFTVIAFREPRRADARRSWSNVCLCIAKIVVSPADVRTATQERLA